MKWEQRLRHSRGYGVHSPFLYGVVRQAMMPHHMVGGPTQLHSDLQAAGIDKRTATRLQNYLHHVGLSEWSIDKVPSIGAEESLMIATPDCPTEVLKQMITTVVGSEEHNTKATLCVIHRRGKTSKRLRRRLVAEHKGMSAEKRHFTLLFFNPALPKQHIII